MILTKVVTAAALMLAVIPLQPLWGGLINSLEQAQPAVAYVQSFQA